MGNTTNGDQRHNFLGHERVGLTFTTKYGTTYVVVDYVNASNVTIKFLDDFEYTYSATWAKIKQGSVRNPYDKTIVGIGYLGLLPNGEKPVTTYSDGNSTKEYVCWADMIRRCYDEHYWINNPTYRHCSVCERWHNFSNFLVDIESLQGYNEWIVNSGWEIDKDLKQQNVKNKVYSPDTCCFIKQNTNVLESSRRSGFADRNKIICTLYNDDVVLTFASVQDAANYLGVSRVAVNKAHRQNRPCKGYYVEKGDVV